MKLQIIFRDLPEWKRDFLEADFSYFKASAKYEMFNALDQIKHNRGIVPKIVNVIKSHNSMAKISVEAMLTSLDVLKDYILFTYDVAHNEKLTVVNFEANEEYFEMVDILKRGNPLHLHVGFDKEKMLKHMNKELKKCYGNVEIIRVKG